METFGAQRNVTNADAEQFCSSNTENNQPISDEIECEKRCVKLKTILKGIRNQNFGADNILNEYLLDGDILFSISYRFIQYAFSKIPDDWIQGIT